MYGNDLPTYQRIRTAPEFAPDFSKVIMLSVQKIHFVFNFVLSRELIWNPRCAKRCSFRFPTNRFFFLQLNLSLLADPSLAAASKGSKAAVGTSRAAVAKI